MIGSGSWMAGEASRPYAQERERKNTISRPKVTLTITEVGRR